MFSELCVEKFSDILSDVIIFIVNTKVDQELSLNNCSLLFLCLKYRTPYMPPTQQYPVTSGTGFYQGTSPAEYPFGKNPPLHQILNQRPTTIKHNSHQ